MLSNRDYKKWAAKYDQELRELYQVFKENCASKRINIDHMTLNIFANFVYKNSDRR